MIKKILVAYDGSESAGKAFSFALDLAKRYAAALTVLSVALLPEPPEDVETEAVLESAKERYEKLFAALKQKAGEEGVAPHFEIVAGHPAERIIYFAEQNGVDLIVMGHRGKTFIERWLLGSVSKRVISYARCSVTVVR